ncbi:helix-turn-helix domain-containing protein [Azospirillum doebereinerae]|uniref:XRE family transcriptional regulator n=1 Tax=Azospirillum doebereinerae TaxID=92933 RepID=A0A3S0XRF3_9PROT|nr:helix-turn-helix transcriptional regulator [Azospirillum doebereinerae]RUQ76047.1 XRE family transcriptional regulator [Azospirillum doebereinerae]
MTLDDWLTRTGTKEDAFAASIGTSQAAVNRYRHGLRVPRPPVMARIAQATGGAVTANDFHGLSG